MKNFWIYIPLIYTFLQITEFNVERDTIAVSITNIWFIIPPMSLKTLSNIYIDKIVEATTSLMDGKYNNSANMHFGNSSIIIVITLGGSFANLVKNQHCFCTCHGNGLNSYILLDSNM